MVRSMSERRFSRAQRSELIAALFLVGLCPVVACAGKPDHFPANKSLIEPPHRRVVVEPALKTRGPNFIAYFLGDASVRVFTGGDVVVRRGRGSDGGRTLHVVADEFGEGCDLPSLSLLLTPARFWSGGCERVQTPRARGAGDPHSTVQVAAC